jgi:hypothetical protein
MTRSTFDVVSTIIVVLVSVVIGIWGLWCTWIAFAGGTFPIPFFVWTTSGGFWMGLLFLFIVTPLLTGLAYQVFHWGLLAIGLLVTLLAARMRPALWLCLIGVITSLVAVGQLPYDYYTFNRFVVTVRNKVPGWLAGLIPLGLLWNPILPLYLNRTTWAPLDVLAAVFLLICGLLIKRVSATVKQPVSDEKVGAS